MDSILTFIEFLADVLGSIAALIAIYLFAFKRKDIATVFGLLVNYTYQITLSELKEKLERLNEYNANDPDGCDKIINIMHEITGQIRGNDRLSSHFEESLRKIDKLMSDKRKLTEPRKRAMVAELRERLRNLNVKNIDSIMGGDK